LSGFTPKDNQQSPGDESRIGDQVPMNVPAVILAIGDFEGREARPDQIP
jgi:hypothetical protein